MTNYERIINMTVEELATDLVNFMAYTDFVDIMDYCKPYIFENKIKCIIAVIRYLESEMKQND